MNSKTPSREPIIGLSIAQTVKQTGVGRSTLYQELKAGRLKARKLGRRTIILAADLATWMSNLPTIRP